LFAVLTSLTGSTTPVVAPSSIDSATVRQVEDRKSPKEIGTTLATEEYVRQYFSDIPIMVQIAKCESHFHQVDKYGNIQRGNKTPADIGVMQINETYHKDEARKFNYDIYSLEGNTAYARKLYNEQGTEPWRSSKACWNGNQDLATLNQAIQTN